MVVMAMVMARCRGCFRGARALLGCLVAVVAATVLLAATLRLMLLLRVYISYTAVRLRFRGVLARSINELPRSS